MFEDYIKRNLTTFIELKQLIYCDSQIYNNNIQKKYNKDFQKEEFSVLKSKKFHNQNREKKI